MSKCRNYTNYFTHVSGTEELDRGGSLAMGLIVLFSPRRFGMSYSVSGIQQHRCCSGTIVIESFIQSIKDH